VRLRRVDRVWASVYSRPAFAQMERSHPPVSAGGILVREWH
jgi:hypothetical protein